MKTILLTERLRLREFTLDDAPVIFNLNEDPEVIRYVGDPRCEDMDAARTVLSDIILPQYERYGIGRWAVEIRENGEVAGWCGIKFLVGSKEYDLGYRFFRKHWGKGFATESARASLDLGHRDRGLNRIIGKADVENTGSVNVLKKLGMKFVANAEEHGSNIAIYESVFSVKK